MKIKIIVISVLIVLLFPMAIMAATSSNAYNYSPMESIPGASGTPADFCSYMTAIYDFGIAVVGICAMFMIIIGGFMYASSAGNNASMEKAKGVITDAIIGLLLALCSWLILYIINPDLLKCKVPSSAGGPPSSISQPIATLPANCNSKEWQNLFDKVSTDTGVDKCILMATAAKESSCNQIPSRTKLGRDCGVTQIAAKDNCGTTCEDLESNPEKALTCSANYYKKCSSQWRGEDGSEQQIQDMYAGYNGGCGALDPSVDCAGQKNSYGNDYQKWDCPINQNGYSDVPGRTATFYNFYKQCKGA